MCKPRAIAVVFILALALPLAAAAQAPPPPPGGASGGPRSTEQAGWTSVFQGRLAILWLTDLGGEVVVVGKTFRPEAMHRVTVGVTGRKAEGASKKDAKLMAYGSSGEENAVEHVLAAAYPLTVRATLRVPERLPRQGKPAILKTPPAPGTSISVFCSLTPEELTKCVPSEESYVAVDRATCERLAAGSERLEATACEGLPEVSPVASVLVLENRATDEAEAGR
jgi:hypothetical protein